MEYDELLLGVKNVGTGCGLDGIRSDIIRMIPPSYLRLLTLMNRVFTGAYPKQCEIQVLNAIAKDGHSPRNPKLRGIGIAVIMARIYDIMLDERFRKWYLPNREQSAFRPLQGPPLPLFSIFLLIHYANEENKDLCIGFMDYEKAFDYANRANIIRKLIEKGCGKVFTEAIAKMFRSTTYIPSANNQLCEEIVTSSGVAQGRNSSPNLYSFSVSEMGQCTNSLETKDFIDPHCLAQLADDAAVLSDGISLLRDKMRCLLAYSRLIYQVPNIPKTDFCHFSSNPFKGSIQIDEETELLSVDPQKGHRYLGVRTYPTNNINKIITSNIEGRLQNCCKFYAWLEVNKETPIEVKLVVLDGCLFGSILSAVEAFGDISCIEKKLRLAEQKALRCILGVKNSTPVDLLYNEIKRPDIIAKIKDLQYNFYQKVKEFTEEEAVVRSILRICTNTSMVRYYESLTSDNKEVNIREREHRISCTTTSMLQYYGSIVEIKTTSSIYCNYIDDHCRNIITRWRLSNHRLRIETGRYQVPRLERENRKCYECDVLEDENHAIFICPAFFVYTR